MKKQKAFIHIGAGYMQVSGIQFAKSIGLHVVVTDRNDNAPGVKFADRYEKIDGTDTGSCVKLANDISENYDLIGAFSSSDYGLMVMATLVEKFSFPGAAVRAYQSHWIKANPRIYGKRMACRFRLAIA